MEKSLLQMDFYLFTSCKLFQEAVFYDNIISLKF